MSSTFPSNVRTSVSPFGRFLVVCPTMNIDASFLLAQNSSDAGSSNGRTVFFFENEIACGRFSAIYRKRDVVRRHNKSDKSEGETHELLHDVVQHLSCMCAPYEDRRPRLLDFFWLAGLHRPL